jgi:hypothetical protein
MSDTPVPYRQLYGPPDQLIVGALVHEGEQVTTGGFVGRIREQSFVHETSEGSSDQFYIPGNGAVEKQAFATGPTTAPIAGYRRGRNSCFPRTAAGDRLKAKFGGDVVPDRPFRSIPAPAGA